MYIYRSNLYIYIDLYIYIYISIYIYIDQICVKVFGRTVSRTEVIYHSLERKFYGVWNRPC